MKQIKYKNNIKIKDNTVIKKRKVDINTIYNNLDNRGFNNYLKPIEINNINELYEYIDEIEVDDATKSMDLIYLTSILHSKTTNFLDKNIDEIKKNYEDTINTLNNTYNYYSNLQDKIEEHIYMSPAELLLMNNIYKIYFMLNTSRYYLEKYYEIMETQNRVRKSIIHGNLNLTHILESKDQYLISWNKSRIDYPIIDLENYIRNDFDKIEINSNYELYQSKYKLLEEEKYLLFSKINIPPIIYLNKSNYINAINIRRLVTYTDKIMAFTSQQNNKDEESESQEFKQQDNSI